MIKPGKEATMLAPCSLLSQVGRGYSNLLNLPVHHPGTFYYRLDPKDVSKLHTICSHVVFF